MRFFANNADYSQAVRTATNRYERNDMQPHQERVVTEKQELDEKLSKLNAFIGGTTYSSLPEDERKRLIMQADVMTQYSEILGQRIAAF